MLASTGDPAIKANRRPRERRIYRRSSTKFLCRAIRWLASASVSENWLTAPSPKITALGELLCDSGVAQVRDFRDPVRDFRELKNNNRADRFSGSWSSARLHSQPKVGPMITCLSALHAIAAQRGEGLRRELVRLLELSTEPGKYDERGNAPNIRPSEIAPVTPLPLSAFD